MSTVKDTKQKPAKAADKPEAVQAAETGAAEAEAAVARGYEQAFEATRRNVEATAEVGLKAVPDLDEVIAFNKETVEAFVRSGTVFGQGVQEVGRYWLDSAEKSLLSGAEGVRALMLAKSLPEALETQRRIAKGGVEAWMSEGTEIARMTAKVIEDASAPLAGRFKAAVKGFAAPRSG